VNAADEMVSVPYNLPEPNHLVYSSGHVTVQSQKRGFICCELHTSMQYCDLELADWRLARYTFLIIT
jgi:hypothetical protein